MEIRRLEPSDVELVASWLAAEENHRWLDFGQGVQALPAVSLRLMMQRPLHGLFAFSSDAGPAAVGIVGLSNIDRKFGTATLWYVLGDKRAGGRGYTTRAVKHVLGLAFGEMGLRSVNAWAVDANRASVRVLEKSGFRPVGRLRQCHAVGGTACDRMVFDILAGEATPAEGRKPAAARRPGRKKAPRTD